MQIQISWLLQKPTDLDLHCLQRKGISGFSRTRVKLNHLVLQFLFFDFALKIMLLVDEIWHRGQIKQPEFRDVREKSFSTF